MFSETETDHVKLLQQFHQLVQQYEIMLSEKKMIIEQNYIEFLGMRIANGTYVPQPHITIHLAEFFDKDLTTKQVQQFIGIVN